MKTYSKSFSLKSAASGAEVTPEMLAKINKFPLKPLATEDVYVRKYLLAHNAVDRDRERFPEGMLDEFSQTLPGKSFLFMHNKQYLPLGLWFDAQTETMTSEQFKALTGEDALLPPGVSTVKVMWSWFYMLKNSDNQAMMDNIDAGIYRQASIGFAASDLIAVKGQYQDTMYYEYVSPAEALEGSLVWLGAQPGATSQKGADDNPPEKGVNIKNRQKEVSMIKVKALLGLSDDASEEATAKSLGEKLTRLKSLEAMAEAVGEDATVESVKALKASAEDGREYKKNLVEDALRFGALIEEIPTDAEKQKAEKAFIETWPVTRVKDLKDKYEARARKQFPDKFTIKGKDEENRQDKGAGGGESPLVAEAKARAEAAKK